ncbi:hypothetical protein B0H14DRAFT_3425062 [Mycena olivaceomarginata]|nr:hypothetical protein B0H14DRAFT_3425062 [Mycena olivaceomarginata]
MFREAHQGGRAVEGGSPSRPRPPNAGFCAKLETVTRVRPSELELELDADVALEEDSDEPNDNHDNSSNSTDVVLPVSPTVRARSESTSASASVHGFYTPSPIHTGMPPAQRPLPRSRFAFGINAPPASPSSASSASGSALMPHPLPASPNFPSPLAPLPRPPLAPTCLLSTISCAAFPHLRAPHVIPVQLPLHPLHAHIAHPCAGDYVHAPPLSPSHHPVCPQSAPQLASVLPGVHTAAAPSSHFRHLHTAFAPFSRVLPCPSHPAFTSASVSPHPPLPHPSQLHPSPTPVLAPAFASTPWSASRLRCTPMSRPHLITALSACSRLRVVLFSLASAPTSTSHHVRRLIFPTCFPAPTYTLRSHTCRVSSPLLPHHGRSSLTTALRSRPHAAVPRCPRYFPPAAAPLYCQFLGYPPSTSPHPA